MVAGQLALITAALFAGAAVYISRPRKWRFLELTNGVGRTQAPVNSQTAGTVGQSSRSGERTPDAEFLGSSNRGELYLLKTPNARKSLEFSDGRP
jgi:hypothetical protein